LRCPQKLVSVIHHCAEQHVTTARSETRKKLQTVL